MSNDAPEQISEPESAELLRLTLPLMARYKVPVTPRNYAVWFDFVRGSNPQMKAEIQQLIDTHATFTSELNDQLYEKYKSDCDVRQFAKIHSEMSELMGDLSQSLKQAGNQAQHFGGHLDGVVESVQHKTGIDDILDLLKSLLEETRSMRKSTQLLHEHLEAKSREIDLLQEELQKEKKRSSTDPLTGLANRQALIETLTQMSQTTDKPDDLALIMVDIDHFKEINDRHGHLIGDRVIRFVAQVLKDNTKGRDLAARYGGEEFLVMLPDTGLRGAGALAEKIRTTVANAKLIRSDNKQPLGQITISIGVAGYHPGEDMLETINRADQSLYRAKQGGRNQTTIDWDTLDIADQPA